MKLAVRRTSTAIAAVATAGVSSLFLGAVPASAATTDACGDGTLIAPGVCEQTFTSGTASFTPSAQMTKLEVLLVGAGGAGADQQVPNTNGYAAAGGGGAVKIVDFSGATAPLNLTVAASGVTGAASDGTTNATVGNGVDASFAGETGGASGSGFPGAVGISDSATRYGAGGGAGASPIGNANGGAGVVVNTLALSGSLFSGDLRCFGGGGAIGVVGVQGLPGCGGGAPAGANGTALLSPAANSGGGGGGVSSTQLPAARAGAAGLVVIRWNGATVALNFDTSGRGVAPASQSIVAGTAGVLPSAPTAQGYEFSGWFTDAALTTPADFSALLASSTTYYASWVKVLPATGDAPDAAALPLGLAALLAGVGLFGFAHRRKRTTN